MVTTTPSMGAAGREEEVRKCYLGPKEYIAAERFNRLSFFGLAFPGLRTGTALKLQILNGSLKK
jgi:hypothetical protein